MAKRKVRLAVRTDEHFIKTKKKKKMEQAINKNGVKIKKCCASCEHKDFDKGGNRLCMRGNGHVLKDEVCPLWHISEKMDGIKKSVEEGKVKRPEWLQYLLYQVDCAAKIAEAAGKRFQGISEEKKEAMKRSWESKHGDVYL